eukprot:g1642.t1
MLRAQVIKCESLLIRALQFEFDEPTKAAFELLDKFCRKVPEVFANQCRDKSGVRAGSGVESSDNSCVAAANLASIRSPESDASSIAGRSSTPGARGGREFSGAGGIGVYGGGGGASSGSSLFTAFGAGSGAGRSGFGTVEGGSVVGAATPGGRNGNSTTATHNGAFGVAARKRAADDEDDDIPFVGRKKRSSANPLLAPATSAQQPHNSQMSSASSAVSSRSAPPSRSGAAGAGTRLPDAIQVEIRRRAVSFLFDAHRSVMPLKYTPRVLALGCLKLALKFVAKRTGVGGLAALDLCALDRKVVIQSRRGTEGFVDWASNQIGDVGADFNVILKPANAGAGLAGAKKLLRCSTRDAARGTSPTTRIRVVFLSDTLGEAGAGVIRKEFQSQLQTGPPVDLLLHGGGFARTTYDLLEFDNWLCGLTNVRRKVLVADPDRDLAAVHLARRGELFLAGGADVVVPGAAGADSSSDCDFQELAGLSICVLTRNSEKTRRAARRVPLLPSGLFPAASTPSASVLCLNWSRLFPSLFIDDDGHESSFRELKREFSTDIREMRRKLVLEALNMTNGRTLQALKEYEQKNNELSDAHQPPPPLQIQEVQPEAEVISGGFLPADAQNEPATEDEEESASLRSGSSGGGMPQAGFEYVAEGEVMSITGPEEEDDDVYAGQEQVLVLEENASASGSRRLFGRRTCEGESEPRSKLSTTSPGSAGGSSNSCAESAQHDASEAEEVDVVGKTSKPSASRSTEMPFPVSQSIEIKFKYDDLREAVLREKFSDASLEDLGLEVEERSVDETPSDEQRCAYASREQEDVVHSCEQTKAPAAEGVEGDTLSADAVLAVPRPHFVREKVQQSLRRLLGSDKELYVPAARVEGNVVCHTRAKAVATAHRVELSTLEFRRLPTLFCQNFSYLELHFEVPVAADMRD